MKKVVLCDDNNITNLFNTICKMQLFTFLSHFRNIYLFIKETKYQISDYLLLKSQYIYF